MSLQHDLTEIFAPTSVAVIGASADASRLAGRPVRILQRHGYAGDVYPVNPKYSQLAGLNCYPNVTSIPGQVDLALIMVPAAKVPAILDECGAAAVSNAVIISSGFEETPDGAGLGQEVASIAAKHSINVVGPNSEGVWSVPHKTILTFGSAALNEDTLDGPVSVLSQSGSIGGATVLGLTRRGIGCRYFVSLGNETVLGCMDFLEYVVSEGGSRVVLVYLEGLTGGERLRDLALRARRNDIDIVALRGGDSRLGRQAAATHTGKIASTSDVYSHIFSQCGILQVDSVAELLEAADVLVTARLPRRSSVHQTHGIGVVAPGGSRVLIADQSDGRGVPMAEFSADTEDRLNRVIPSFGSTSNPVDVTGQLLSSHGMFESVVGTVARDPRVEGLLVQYSNRGLQRIDEIRDALAAPGLIPANKPVIVGFLGDVNALSVEERAKFRDEGLIATMGPETAVRYFGWLYESRRSAVAAAGQGTGRTPGTNSPRDGTTQWNAAEAFSTWPEQAAWLAGCGVPLPPWRSVDINTWRTVAAELRFPLAVKAHPDDAGHKTEQGLVRLNINDVGELEEAVGWITDHSPGQDSRALVQEMAADGLEALVSVRSDPDFGPILAVGAGGTLAELLRDLAYVSIPCSESEIRVALSRTRFGELLQSGGRSRDPADIDALVDVLESLSAAYVALERAPAEIELNPVIVHVADEGATAVDVLVVQREGSTTGPTKGAPTR